MKSLSVIVPCYNVEKYIDQCLSSLLADETIFEFLEVICVNDGSTDGTLEKLQKFKNQYPMVVKIVDKENGGHGSGINIGLKLADGLYVKVLDSDDWVITDHLKKLISTINDLDEKPEMIINPFEYVYEGTDQKKVIDYPLLKANELVPLEDMNQNHYSGTIHSITFLTSIFKDHKIRELDEKVSYDDVEYILYPIMYVNRVLYSPDIVYEYRYGSETQSVSFENHIKRRDQHKKIIMSLIAYYQKEKSHFSKAQRRYYLRRLYLMVNDHVNTLLRINDVKTGKRELIQFVEECETLRFDLYKTPNKKLRHLMKTNFKDYSFVKWYFNQFKSK